jgi:SAM-dependent methyltransferase
LAGGRCLDVACGLGANSIFAARAGYAVDAFDISLEAVRSLRNAALSERLPIRVMVADIDEFPLPSDLYDLILIFNFFTKTAASAICDALKRGGTLVCSTYNFRHRSVRPSFNPHYLVPKGGLGPFFPSLDRVLDEPECGARGNLSRLVARRPR